jgi:oxygen-independent coproporphyrinogen-3 oxidase
MAGIYIHIPFCKQACIYCNFHFSTNLELKSRIVNAITKEAQDRKSYLGNQLIETIYFGGGTPSLLSKKQLAQIMDAIYANYTLASHPEITIEVNPDDINSAYAKDLIDLDFNRLSIGIQSFYEEDMKYMHRAHTANQSYESISISQEQGFKTISIDLIYGIPNTSLMQWQSNLENAKTAGIQHLSCYALTVEPKTILAHQIATHQSDAPSDIHTITQFEYLIDNCTAYGFEQYEISNFSVPGFQSKHNGNYWTGVPYLGLGPSAHSYDQKSRQWNIAHNVNYCKAIEQSLISFESESLHPKMIHNETVMTRLRTMKGIFIDTIQPEYKNYFVSQAKPLIERGDLLLDAGHYKLTKQGMFIADRLCVELFV